MTLRVHDDDIYIAVVCILPWITDIKIQIKHIGRFCKTCVSIDEVITD